MSVSEPNTPRKDSQDSSLSSGNQSDSGVKPKKTPSFIEDEMKLNDEEFKQLIWKLKDPKKGVPIKDRKKTFKTYKKCFVGKELVEWIVSNGFAMTKEEAERLSAELYARKVFTAYSNKASHFFRGDATSFYRFSEDDSTISIVEIPKSYKSTNYKFCVLGGEKVGKTSFCRRYTLGESGSDLSVDSLAISGNEQYHKKLAFKLEDAQENADIELMDTKSIAGEDFEANLVKWNEWANGFLLIYSLLSKPSFECISKAFNLLAKIRGFRLTPIVIVATHSDSNEVDKHLLDEAQSLATKFRCQHVQVSCKSASGIDKAIELLADSVRRVKDISNPTTQKTGWVKMRSSSKRAFKKRFLLLTHSGLRYYSQEPSSPNDTSTLKGIIPLQNCTAQLNSTFGGVPRWHSDPNIHKNNGAITPVGSSTPTGTKSPISMSSSLSLTGSWSGSAPNTAPIERRLSEDSSTGSFDNTDGTRSRGLTRNESMISSSSSMMHSISNSFNKGQKMRFFIMDKTETEYEVHFSSFEERDDWLEDISLAIDRANNNGARKNRSPSNCEYPNPNTQSPHKELTPEEIIEQTIERFNKNPKKGISFLLGNGTVENTPAAIAKFLWDNSSHLKKSAIGEYWGEPENFNVDVLKLYLDMIEFKDLPIDEGLRLFLSHFTIPGEAQKIGRILNAFAERYASCNVDLFTPDLALLVAFALLMLNTDAHNRVMKSERMRKDQFVSNIRGVEYSTPLTTPYLEKLYDNIVKKEIQLQHEREEFNQWDKQGYMIVKESKSKGGTLTKKAGRKLFCILAACCLYIFETPLDKKPIHIVPLGNLQVEALSEGGEKLHNMKGEGFILFNPDPKDSIKSAVDGKEVHLKELQFVCENRKTMMEWMLIFKLNLVSAPNYK
eukprot:TRINITY_DN287_c0_g1_i1.p1 TRINITY_DN287_c0_g1~~TRINITY_DN287_c0_g1_i1.p1  ORF type:complete len:894 (+),score=319.39 TRINITY_DN287_c0_g1_i1:253-2934(+)